MNNGKHDCSGVKRDSEKTDAGGNEGSFLIKVFEDLTLVGKIETTMDYSQRRFM